MPSCTLAAVLQRAYRGSFPKGVDLTYSVDPIGRREWSMLDDESSDRHAISDDCR